MKIKVETMKEVEVTPDNELDLLDAEYNRRYGDANVQLGDDVRFLDNGRPKQVEIMGGEHVGRYGIVVAIGEAGSCRVLSISNEGKFVEVWTYEGLLDQDLMERGDA